MRTLAVLIVVFALIFSVGCAACDNCQNCRRCRDCRTDQPCAKHGNIDESTSSSSSAGIRIESARYGRDKEWADVTPQVRGLVSGDTIVFPRDLQATFNIDPVPGRMKYVEMTIIVDGRPMEMTVGDSLHVTPLRIRAVGSARDSGPATTQSTDPKQ